MAIRAVFFSFFCVCIFYKTSLGFFKKRASGSDQMALQRDMVESYPWHKKQTAWVSNVDDLSAAMKQRCEKNKFMSLSSVFGHLFIAEI